MYKLQRKLQENFKKNLGSKISDQKSQRAALANADLSVQRWFSTGQTQMVKKSMKSALGPALGQRSTLAQALNAKMGALNARSEPSQPQRSEVKEISVESSVGERSTPAQALNAKMGALNAGGLECKNWLSSELGEKSQRPPFRNAGRSV